MGPLLLAKVCHPTDMVTLVTQGRDQAMVHQGPMVLDHTGHDLALLEDQLGNTPGILVMASIHHKGGMDQMQEAREVLHQASQVVLPGILV